LKRSLNSPDSIKDEENELREHLREVAKKRAKAVIKFQVDFYLKLFIFSRGEKNLI
jgi:hypothetical protein